MTFLSSTHYISGLKQIDFTNEKLSAPKICQVDVSWYDQCVNGLKQDFRNSITLAME